MFKSRFALLALAGVLAAALPVPASAQFIQGAPARQQTFSASAVGITSAATATDLFTLSGSATKLVVVTGIDCSGIATTAGVADLLLVKRSTANTGGTSTTPTPVPLDSANGTATAVLRAYTANPTVGTAVGTMGAKKLGLPLATGAKAPDTTWNFVQDNYNRPIVLRGVAQSLALNGNGVTLAAGAAVSCTVTWTEQ